MLHTPRIDAQVLNEQVTVTSNGRRGTVLLVEDQGDVRRITQRILEDAGYHVLVADNGADGLQLWEQAFMAKSTIVHVVVTDVVMPALGGRAMVQAIRALDGSVPVLFMSGYVEGGLTDEELAGRTAFLAKPFTSEALLAAVTELLPRDEA